MKKITNKTLLILGSIIAFAALFFYIFLYQTEEQYKKLVITNADSLEKVNDNIFIVKIDNSYYSEISVSLHSDSSYTIICWGNRKSLLWDFRKDKAITVSIPYRRYKGGNVDLDVKLIRVLSSKGINYKP